MGKSKITILLLLLVAVITIAPLYIASEGAFEGADGQAEVVITEIDASYEPWFSPLMEPASGEIESLLFVLQGVIGAGVLGYGLGFMKGRTKEDTKQNHASL